MGVPDDLQGRDSATPPRSPKPLFTTSSRTLGDPGRLVGTMSCGIRPPAPAAHTRHASPWRIGGLPCYCTAIWIHRQLPSRASLSHRLLPAIGFDAGSMSRFGLSLLVSQRPPAASSVRRSQRIGPSSAGLGGRFRTMRQPSPCALPATSRVGDRFPPCRLLADSGRSLADPAGRPLSLDLPTVDRVVRTYCNRPSMPRCRSGRFSRLLP